VTQPSLSEDESEATISRLSERLEAADWGGTVADDASFAVDTGLAELDVVYARRRPYLTFGMHTEDEEGFLQVFFGQRLDAVLDVILDGQDNLDAESWNDFIERLLATGVQVFSVQDYTGADAKELRPLS